MIRRHLSPAEQRRAEISRKTEENAERRLAGGLNQYAHVDGNPVSWIDPLGLKGMPGQNTPPIGDRSPEPIGLNGSKYRSEEVLGRRVYKNDVDLTAEIPNVQLDPSVHPSIRDKIENKGWNNVDLMRNGNAPIDPDGKQINLHHVIGQESV